LRPRAHADTLLGMPIITTNPATGERLAQYETMSDEQVTAHVAQTAEASLDWARSGFAERSQILNRAAKLLRERAEMLATLITSEMGKPISQARAEVEKCAWMCEHNAEEAEGYLASREVATSMSRSVVCYQPLGVVFAIMPWNFPLWQVIRFAAPNLMAGNAALLSHAPISTGIALAIETLFRDAGLPEAVFTTLVIEDAQAAAVIGHPGVAAVTLTGSGRAGRAVATEAARHLKKVVLELGGNDPYLILDDADLDHAADCCVTLRMLVSGQVCVSPKRLIAVASIYDAFEKRVVDRAKTFLPGDPLIESTQLGPLARSDLRATLHDQVERTLADGATCLLGGTLPTGPGFFYPATVLRDIPPHSAAYQEELFGPVICLLRAKDEWDAIRIANDSAYGLGAAVFTKDVERGERIAREEIQAGTCSVNTFVASDPRLPFGGIKQSGYGRESALEGIRELCNVKTINVK
jgi:succinate-semialdehyde dehydrogenase/glutarate-semialdehyde dehydrogenase